MTPLASDIKAAYATLGLPPRANLDQIKGAFRRLAKSCHPDVAGGDTFLAARFTAISSAYNTLIRWIEAMPPGLRARTLEPHPSGPAQRGLDVSLDMRLSLEDAAKGCVRKLTLEDGRTLATRAPAGVASGQVLRLRGQGQPGFNGGPPGDALITVKIARHPQFRLDGRDVHVMLAVAPRDIRAGGRIETPSLHGPLSLILPETVQPGSVLRLKGQGLPACGDKPAGDQFVVFSAKDEPGFFDAVARLADRLNVAA
ncbi:MAG: DnaJ C-terminal domain-containing protein [Maricaulaceae bacterium]